MKKFFPLVILMISIFLVGAKNPPSQSVKSAILLTYPRSGTNWTIGILQRLCKRPVYYLGTKDFSKKTLGLNRLGFEIDESLPHIYRIHKLNSNLLNLDQSQFSLLFTLRNFKECIIKRNQYTADQFLKAILDNDHNASFYFDNLRFFDSGWKDPKTKHIIIYEEMILTNPQKGVTSLLKFLGEDVTGVPEFFEKHYQEWNRNMLNSYHIQHAKIGPPSNNEFIFHSKDFPKKLLRQVDVAIQKRYPDLWNKYLKRYAESDD